MIIVYESKIAAQLYTQERGHTPLALGKIEDMLNLRKRCPLNAVLFL